MEHIYKISSREELKDIVANMDADVYIIRGDVETILGWLEMSDYTGFTTKDVEEIVRELQKDPFIAKLTQVVKA